MRASGNDGEAPDRAPRQRSVWSASPGTFRGRFLIAAVVLLVIPLGAAGVWLARSGERTGRRVVEVRSRETLEELATVVRRRWVSLRSDLLNLVEPGLRPLARGDTRLATARVDSAGLNDSQGDVASLLLRDVHGVEVVRLEGGASPPLLPVVLDLFLPDGTRAGEMEVEVAVSALFVTPVPGGPFLGSVISLYDAQGAPLLPIGGTSPDDLFPPDWIVVRRDVVEPPLTMTIATPAAPVAAIVRDSTRRSLLFLVLLLAVGTVAVAIVAGRITRSLDELADATDVVARGQVPAPVPERGPPEARRLIRGFNTMARNLEASTRRLSQRRALAAMGEMAASLAHEIRNPLTSIRLDLRRARRRVRADPDGAEELVDEAMTQVDRLSKAVEGGLGLAPGGSLAVESVSIDGPLTRTVRAAAPLLADQGCQVSLEVPPELPPVVGDPAALERLFLNLVLNAGEAGSTSVRIVTRAESGLMRITVDDDGPGIDPDELERVTQPFVSTKPEGTGLGLPIARRIAEAHGGRLWIERSDRGGTAVWVELPVAQTGRTRRPSVAPGGARRASVRMGTHERPEP